MIYTVTFNPSLDYIVNISDFEQGKINRIQKEEILPGGKGINVSIVLKNLGVKSVALGFLAGFTGKEIEARIKAHGCDTDFTYLKEGMSRINIKLKSGLESEMNGAGPYVKQPYIRELRHKLDKLGPEDLLVLAGSVPNGLTENIYREILEGLYGSGCKVVIDATGDLLLNSLKYNPFLIKPNNHELGSLFGAQIHSRQEAIPYAKKLQDFGARNVLVSMAAKGAVLLDEHGVIHEADAPKDNVVNSVGAGDSMVAGFLYGYTKHCDYEEAFYFGIATGSASAFSEKLATKDEIEALLHKIKKTVKN